MARLEINEEFHELMALYPLRVVAQKLHRRYGTIREAAIEAGYSVHRGRPLEEERKARLIRCALIRLENGADFCETCFAFDLMPQVLQEALDKSRALTPTRFPPGVDKRP